MVLVKTYFLLLIVNSVVIYLANLFFPNNVVLGTMNIPMWWAILCSMGILALLGTFAVPFVREAEFKRGGRVFSSKEWMILYFILNFIGVWVIARMATFVGLGISSWIVALILAIVLDVVQGFAMMQLEKRRK